jgi:hypothetical protein
VNNLTNRIHKKNPIVHISRISGFEVLTMAVMNSMKQISVLALLTVLLLGLIFDPKDGGSVPPKHRLTTELHVSMVQKIEPSFPRFAQNNSFPTDLTDVAVQTGHWRSWPSLFVIFLSSSIQISR